MTTASLPLAGQSAFVTGGATGIGFASAEAFVRDGASVTIMGRREEMLVTAVAKLEAVAAEGASVRYSVGDVGVEDDVIAAVAIATEANGGLDIAVGSAGTGAVGPILLAPVEELKRVFDTNVTGVLLTIKHAGLAMVASGGGAITIISSLAGVTVHPYMSIYGASKAAADMMVMTAADELGPKGVRVNSVQPSAVETELMEYPLTDTSLVDSYLVNLPISRVGQPDDVGAAVRFLSGPESSWVTGVCMPIDGGHHLRRGPDYSSIARLLYGDDAIDG